MVRCADCIWFDKRTKECIAFSKKIVFPNIRRVCVLYNMVPETVVEYSSSIDKLDPEIKSLDSYGVKNFLKKHKLVRVRR